MKKLMIISLFVIFTTSCASTGYVDYVYENAILINQGGTARVIEKPIYKVKVQSGDYVKFRGHKILAKVYAEY